MRKLLGILSDNITGKGKLNSYKSQHKNRQYFFIIVIF